MTKFLASVKSVQEADLALRGGADIIDATMAGKNDDPELVRQIVRFAAGRKPVCASIICSMDERKIKAMAELYAGCGVDWLLAIFPADSHDLTVLSQISGIGFRGVMLDTSSEHQNGLLHLLSYERLVDFIAQVKTLKLEVGLAGALEAPDVPRLLPLQPDMLGFRRFLLGTDGEFDPRAIEQIRALIPVENGAVPDTSSSGVDFGTDKIFVRDLVLPVEIGAYNYERGKAQKVRFDVIAEVRRLTHDPQDMRHVVSYDVIIDGIRAIVARGHVDLAEALAEQVASHVLADRRVVRVLVRVEKLEIASCRVGVEIERTRAGYDASMLEKKKPNI